MGISNSDNVVRSDETLKVVIKMAFLVLKNNVNFPKFSARGQQNFNFLEIILKFYPTKREKVFQNLNHISFVSWGVTKEP